LQLEEHLVLELGQRVVALPTKHINLNSVLLASNKAHRGNNSDNNSIPTLSTRNTALHSKHNSNSNNNNNNEHCPTMVSTTTTCIRPSHMHRLRQSIRRPLAMDDTLMILRRVE